MSNSTVGQVAQSHAGDEMSNKIAVEEFFSRVAASGRHPRLRMVSGTCEFDITGAGIWRVSLEDGVPTVTKDPTASSPADCVVTCSADELLRMLRHDGHLNALSAYLQGILVVSGDFSFAATVLGSASVDAIGAGNDLR